MEGQINPNPNPVPIPKTNTNLIVNPKSISSLNPNPSPISNIQTTTINPNNAIVIANNNVGSMMQPDMMASSSWMPTTLPYYYYVMPSSCVMAGNNDGFWLVPVGPPSYNMMATPACLPTSTKPPLPENNCLPSSPSSQPTNTTTNNNTNTITNNISSSHGKSPSSNFIYRAKVTSSTPSTSTPSSSSSLTNPFVVDRRGIRRDLASGLRVTTPTCAITTLMICNVPISCSQQKLIEILDGHCQKFNTTKHSQEPISSYDFIYLPVEAHRNGLPNLGYAFVNFTSPEAAERFRHAFNNKPWSSEFKSKKICEVKDCHIQGFTALVNKYRRKLKKMENDACMPLSFTPPRNGPNSSSSAQPIAGQDDDQTSVNAEIRENEKEVEESPKEEKL